MRTLLLCLVACSAAGPADDDPDAGDTFTCDPGSSFCSGGSAWTCTLEGHDATLADECLRNIANVAHQGYCSETRCDAGEAQSPAVGVTICCVP